MTYVYATIGRAVVRLVWRRYGGQIQALAAAGVVAVGLGLWIAGRASSDPEQC